MSKTTLSHRQRIEACISNQRPDRVPVALWRHFPMDDQTPGGLAEAVADFQRQFDFDLIKVSPNSSYCIRDWGAQDQWQGSSEGTNQYLEPLIQSPQDWLKLSPQHPRQGSLNNMLLSLQMLQTEFSPHTPIIQTIFSPLAQAKNLAGTRRLVEHLRCFPEEVQAGLETITTTILRFIEELVKMKLDGIFYA
ncbi:MAG: uroporphyrinogen decarboxylase, partial [Chloroflexi bacterium]|nr:uroporphyrinogen decarboxylase [Chloroflexota bacterium]